jgi:D-tyrosyl-tRNA(Tyr) deacylase
MKLLIQKVKNLKIYQDQKLFLNLSSESFCFLIYVGVEKEDKNKNLKEIIKNLESLEIVDLNGKFNQTLEQTKPKIVFVSQITLLADFIKGRINFNYSSAFLEAKMIFDEFVDLWQKLGYNVYKTEFGSYLEIENINLGPVNFFISY